MDNTYDLHANESKGLASLRDAVQHDCSKAGGVLNEAGFSQCVKGCFHPFKVILDGWEERRTCWYLGYYEEYSQPLLARAGTRVSNTIDEYIRSLGSRTFLCPACSRVSKSEQRCTVCGWNVSGFFGDMGKGVFIYIKRQQMRENHFQGYCLGRRGKSVMQLQPLRQERSTLCIWKL